jgi:uncharacterized protein with HEPN domain
MKDDRLYLIHIVECIERIEAYTRRGREAFQKSEMRQDAVIRKFEIMGEAAKRVSEELRVLHPAIPWRQIAGFRDVLIHNYFNISLKRVWNVVQNDLPQLKLNLKTILQELEPTATRSRPRSPRQAARPKKRKKKK